jgi:DNA-binding transcriptional LysR family regulator
MAYIDRALRSNIKLRHLQLVAALNEFRHLGKTAEFLRVTQPAVSKMLNEIEEMLELKLFDRSRRGTEPTLAGLSFIRFTHSVLASYEQAREEIKSLEKGVAGRAKIGAMVAGLPTLLAPAIKLLKQDSKEATVLIEEGDLTNLLPKLRLGELDLFIGRLEPGYAAPDLITEPLYQDKMTFVVKPNHSLSSLEKISLEAISTCRMVAPPPWASMRVKLEQQFYKHGLQPPVDIVESASFLTQLTLLHDQNAVALMAESVGKHYENMGMLKRLDIKLALEAPPIGMIRMREKNLTPIVSRLREILLEYSKYPKMV